MDNLKFAKNSKIFEKGDSATEMFIVKQGRVRIMSSGGGEAVELAIVKDGAFFGEMGIIEKSPRSATAFADTDVELLSIDEKSFAAFVQQNPADTVALMKQLSGNLRKTTSKLIDASKTVAQLVDSEDEPAGKTKLWDKLKTIARIHADNLTSKQASATDKRNFAKGEVIFYKGEKSDKMYKVMSGEIAFYKDVVGDGEVLAEFGPGKIIGEMGVLEKEPRSATAIAKTDVTVLPITMAAGQLELHISNVPEDALTILKNISKSLRTTTANYIETLKTISDIWDNAGGKSGGVWGDLELYANEYHRFLLTGFDSAYSNYMDVRF